MRSSRHPARPGFSIFELTAVMALMGLVLGLTVPLFRTQLKLFEKQAGRQDAQQNARFGVSMIDRELRTAGVGLPEPQPMIVQAGKYAITFNSDLVSRVQTDIGAVYYNPDVSASQVTALLPASRINLPISGTGYPDTTYTQAGGAPSEAETISFWVAADPDPAAGGLSALFRRVNDGPVSVVAKAIKLNAGEPVFRYFKSDTLGQPVEISQSLLPLTHSAKIHGSKADTLWSALTDSIRIVRVRINGVYIDRAGKQLTRTIDTGVRIMNSGLLRFQTCGEPPLFSSILTATATTDPTSEVVLSWTKSGDETTGEKDVENYAIYRRRVDDAAFSEPFASVPAGLSSYSFTDTQVASGEAWVYAVSAQDCDGQSSPMSLSSTVTIP